jgi:hypothetical protein
MNRIFTASTITFAFLFFLCSCNNETKTWSVPEADSVRIVDNYKNSLAAQRDTTPRTKSFVPKDDMPTSYGDIKNYSASFLSELQNCNITFPDQANTPLVIKASVKDLAKELGRLIKESNCKQIAFVPGIHNNGRFTVCILALDINGNVLTKHIDGLLDGEETWPDTQVIKLSQLTDYQNFLPPANHP